MKNFSIVNKSFSLTVGAALCLTILFAARGFGQKQTPDYYAHLKAEHTATIKNYIGKRANLRPAQISDCKNKFGLDSLRQSAGKSAHPYYAAKDFNRDKIADFAIVLFDAKAKADSRFTILIFNGAKTGDYKLASTTAGADLRQGGIWTDGFGTDNTKTSLTAGEYETDNCIWIEWENGKYVVHDCEEGAN